jgi:hypothetical protein
MRASDEILSHHLAQALRPFGMDAPPGSGPERRVRLIFSVHRLRNRIDFNFILSGRVAADLAKIVIPDVLGSGDRRRRDELWKSTCLEVFIGRADRSSYLELNLSPSGDWNLYAFEKYRAGMRAATLPMPPLTRVERAVSGDMIAWHGSLSGGAELDELLVSPGLVMNATAVLEYRSGEQEYWALAHAGEKPDFHHRESFRLSL